MLPLLMPFSPKLCIVLGLPIPQDLVYKSFPLNSFPDSLNRNHHFCNHIPVIHYIHTFIIALNTFTLLVHICACLPHWVIHSSQHRNYIWFIYASIPSTAPCTLVLCRHISTAKWLGSLYHKEHKDSTRNTGQAKTRKAISTCPRKAHGIVRVGYVRFCSGTRCGHKYWWVVPCSTFSLPFTASEPISPAFLGNTRSPAWERFFAFMLWKHINRTLALKQISVEKWWLKWDPRRSRSWPKSSEWECRRQRKQYRHESDVNLILSVNVMEEIGMEDWKPETSYPI